MIFISYYTRGTPYEEEVKNLIGSLKKFNLTYVVYPTESVGSWCGNCALKPSILLRALNDYPNEDSIVYLDADAIILKPPELFKHIQSDIAVHYKNGSELLSGTIFLRNTIATRKLLENWIRHQTSDVWDQKVLQEVIKTGNVSMSELPKEYVHIFDDNPTQDTVIIHNQASRRFKRAVDAKAIGSVPESMFGMKIRRRTDGTIFIPRRHRELEAYLDKHYIRHNGELVWSLQRFSFLDWEFFRSVFGGKHCYIIGKGKSLDVLESCDFQSGCPIITINESIHKVENLDLKNPIYAMQQDMGLKNTCKPKRACLLVSVESANWYVGVPNVFIFDHLEIGRQSITAVKATQLLIKCGCSEITYMCFDAAHQNGSLDYGNCIGYSATNFGSTERFKRFVPQIRDAAKSVKYQFVLPRRAQI